MRTAVETAQTSGVTSRRKRDRLAWVVLAALSGAATALAFAPSGLWPLALVGPVPLLLVWLDAPPGRAARAGFVAGAVFFGVVVSWVWFFGVVAYFPFVAVLAAYWALAGLLVGLLPARHRRNPLVVASVWTIVEALRGRWPLGGFSWGETGYAFHDLAVARSVAAWGGVLLVSFLAVLVSASVALAVRCLRDRAGSRAAARPLAVAAAVGVLVLAAHLALPGTTSAGRLRVAVVQGNDLNRDLTVDELRSRLLPRKHFALAGDLDGPLDLVVFPESSLDGDPRGDPFLEPLLRGLATRLDAAVLANAAVEIEGGRRLHNTNFHYGPDGNLADTYVKQHLVPFGEYVPLRSVLDGIVDEIDQVPRDYAPGKGGRLFQVAGVPVANLICFESAFGGLARDGVREGAEILVVSTNNRSFQRSANAAQHVAIGKIRAAETGRPVVHAGVSGRSAVIDHRGGVRASTDLFDATTLTASVDGRTGRTPYVVAGDWILLVAGAVLVATGLRVAAARRHVPEQPNGFARPHHRS